MPLRFLLFCWLLSCGLLVASQARGQGMLTGQVRDSLTQEPLAFASVFLASTTRGATTDDQGRFVLRDVPPASYDLVVSYVGYKLYKRAVVVREDTSPLTLLLTPAANQLKEVVVRPNPNRASDYLKFVELFLGRTSFSRQCRIRNPDDVLVEYDNDARVLTASAYTFVQVDNLALGYRIKYYGLRFSTDFRQMITSFYGQPVFEEMVPRSKRQQQLWEANRAKAYRGSLTHFLQTVRDNQVAANGFVAQRVRIVPNPRFPRIDSLLSKLRRERYLQELTKAENDSIARWSKVPRAFSLLYTAARPIDSLRRQSPDGTQTFLRFRDHLQVTYLNEAPDPLYSQANFTKAPKATQPQQLSQLILLEPETEIQANGQLVHPLSVFTDGYWGFEKIGEFLPVDYRLPKPVPAP